jgi:hypothetical protein
LTSNAYDNEGNNLDLIPCARQNDVEGQCWRSRPVTQQTGMPVKFQIADAFTHQPIPKTLKGYAKAWRRSSPRLGREGYRKVHMASYHTASHLAGQIGKIGPFEIIYGGNPAGGIPVLCWKIKDGSGVRIQSIRPGRPLAGPRMAGARLRSAAKV